jgi:hypothetical protein
MLFKLSAALSAVILMSGCGTARNQDSSLSSEKFSISILGIEMGSCTRDELTRFVGGENVPAISDKISADQAAELRQKFSRVIKISPNRVAEALASPLGSQMNETLESIFPRDFSKQRVAEAFTGSLQDGSLTLLEFVSLYSAETLHVNGIVFLAKKGSLENLFLKMEEYFQ